MRRTALLAAVAAIASASAAQAAITIGSTTTTSGGRQAVNIFGLNDGVGTGTRLQAVELTYTGTPVRFVVDDTDEDEIGDTVNLNARVAGQSWLGLSTGTNTAYVGVSPNGSGVQPNPYASISSFTLAMADLAGGILANTGNGGQFMRLISATGTAAPTGRIVGTIAGETGPVVAFDFSFGSTPPPVNNAPVITANAGTTVAFGNIVTTPLPFSATVTANDGDTAAQTLSLALGSIPAGLTNVQVTPASVSDAGTFTITGLAAWIPGNGSYSLPFTVSDNGSPAASTPGNIVITVVPEPATLGVLAGLGLLGLRRRK